MFSGLIEACVPLRGIELRGGGAQLRLPLPTPDWRVSPGESVAVCGACLSVTGAGEGELRFELSAETLARTCFADMRPGTLLNLERSLRLSDRLGGHLVTGHVDGLARIAGIGGDRERGWTWTFEVEPGLERFLVDKGCIAVHGISLTVVNPRARLFDVAVIPLTHDHTSLGSAKIGEQVHIEADLIAKYVEKLLVRR